MSNSVSEKLMDRADRCRELYLVYRMQAENSNIFMSFIHGIFANYYLNRELEFVSRSMASLFTTKRD